VTPDLTLGDDLSEIVGVVARSSFRAATLASHGGRSLVAEQRKK
jgi:hypothetical protein